MAGAVPSTTYATSTAFHVYTSSQFLTTQTYTFVPQTTPFSPPAGCTSELFCSMVLGDVSSGRVCYEYDSITSTGSAYISGTCFPDGYKDIFNHGATFSDAVTLAYPGDTCPTGWHPQCTRAVLSASGATSATVIQTWCCPSGFTECQATLDARNCVRYTTSNIPMWVIKDGTTTSNTNRESLTKSLASGETLTVLKAAFPLVGARANTGGSSFTGSAITGVPQTGGGGGPSDTTTTGGNGAVQTGSSDSGLSSGAIAGIAVGAVGGVALLVALGAFFFIRRRRAAANGSGGTHAPVPQAPPSTDANTNMSMYNPSSMGSPGQYPPSAYDPHSTWYSKDFPPGSAAAMAAGAHHQHPGAYPPGGGVYDPHAPRGPDGTYYGVKPELAAHPQTTVELDSSQVAQHAVPVGSNAHFSPVEMDSGTPVGGAQLHPNSMMNHPHFQPNSPSVVSSVPGSATPMGASPVVSPQPGYRQI